MNWHVETDVPHSLELNIHQLILSDLAASIGESKDHTQCPDVTEAIEVVASKVATRDVVEAQMIHSDEAETEVTEERVFMVRQLDLAHTLLAFNSRPVVQLPCAMQYWICRACYQFTRGTCRGYRTRAGRYSP